MQHHIARLLFACALAPAAAWSMPVEQASRKIADFTTKLAQTPGFAPAYAIVIVDRDRTHLMQVSGELKAGSGVQATADSPFYIASMTKAYLGLLAAELDARGVLKLDSTLATYWPELKTASGVQLGGITLRQLLSHEAAFEADLIAFMESYSASVPAKDYPRLLAATAVARPAGFKYANLGYNVYAAVLAQVTGRVWQDWLQQAVFAPMGMTRTSARTSTFGANAVAWRHQWTGERWELLEPKTDAVMQSAGGIHTSPHDMALWLRHHLAATSVAGGPSAAAFKQALSRSSSYPATKGDLPCDGYTLGWHACKVKELEVYAHGGGYSGMRTNMLLVPGKQAGIAFLTNSDSMTGMVTLATSQLFAQYLADDPGADAQAEALLARYRTQLGKQTANRRAAADKRKTDPRWKGGDWQPADAELQAYAGTYGHPILGELAITVNGGKLSWRNLAYRMALLPASRDLFAGHAAPYDEGAVVSFTRDAAGAIRSVTWDGEVFQRQ
ncbi:MAG TPA: serine hydrolase [Burkholderiaceae bacterium]